MTRPRWCQHTKPHRPHRWLLARRVQQCPGVVGPPADAAARSGLRPLPVMTAPAGEPLLVRCQSNPEPHVVDDHCRDIYEAPAVAPADEPVSVPPPGRQLATGGIVANPPVLLVNEGAGCTLTVPPPAADRSPSLLASAAGAYGAPADEPASVPPPVDALLKLIAQYGQHTNEEAHGGENAGFFASGTYRRIEIALDALWASGVAEGRRQATEERTEGGRA